MKGPHSTFSIRRGGFTLIEIMIVIAILAMIIAIAVPNFLKSRTHARMQVCIENLSQIESAKQLWGLEAGKQDGEVPVESDLVGPSLYIKTMPQCPAGGAYSFNGIGANATCDIPGHSL